MAEKVDRRVRKTKAQLRAGLARLMQKKSIKEITVKELVEEVDINRSTFYLHYTDIYQMLESIEAELMDEVSHLVEDYPLDPLNNKESSYPFIEQYQFFCKQKSSCLQDSPPVADCFSGIIGIISLRRSVILPGDFFVSLEHYGVITYGIKKWGCHIVICYPHIGQ